MLQTGALPLGYVTKNLERITGLEIRKATFEPSAVPAKIWSGLRGSNPPPRPWQGRALPNELNPRVAMILFSIFTCGKNRGDPKGTRTPDL